MIGKNGYETPTALDQLHSVEKERSFKSAHVASQGKVSIKAEWEYLGMFEFAVPGKPRSTAQAGESMARRKKDKRKTLYYGERQESDATNLDGDSYFGGKN